MTKPQVFRARYIFPVESPPIEYGAITVQDGRIIDFGRAPAGDPGQDLGEAAILPGLVNAHTHLEFSDLAQPLPVMDGSFPSWLQAVVDFRRARRDPEPPDPRPPILRGLSECLRTGTTLIGEIATGPWPFDPSILTPIDGVVFRELMGNRDGQLESHLAEARRHMAMGREWKESWQPGISPHAPYTTTPELVEQVAALSSASRIPIAMHLAESTDELELLASHCGPLVRLLEDLGAWNPAAVPRGIETGDYLNLLARAHRALIVHGNYLASHEWDFLACHRANMSVVYCPRTHAYFGHPAYPLAEMLRRGIRVALGTDSRASNPDLDLWREMRHVAQHHADVSARDTLRLGTLAGAQALGWDDQLGSIAAGKRANLMALPLPPHGTDDPHDLLFLSEGPPTWMVRDGHAVDCGGLDHRGS